MEIFPINFLDSYEIDGHSIRYSDFIEISQGGPEVGTAAIDGKPVGGKGDYFGGPPFLHQGKMFVPRLIRALPGRYFKTCVINLSGRSIKEIGGKEELVLISKVDDSSVYFFRSNPNTKLEVVRWN